MTLEEFWASDPQPMPIRFVASKNGTYRIRIAAQSTAGGSYTLRTKRQTPREQMAGSAVVTPTVRYKAREWRNSSRT